MKRIITISLLTVFAANIHAKNTETIANSVGLPPQHYTPTTKLQPDEYMSNTLIIKVLPAYRSQCTNQQISIPSVVDYFTMIGVDNIKKIYPLKKAP
ncbi:MAG TPA: hypothetical protein VFJ43_15915, partial [Bacteroidia bacterium]|nr:hypothetical protein [Bacteroidia bacterium]